MTIVVSYDKFQTATQSLHGIHANLSGLLQAGPDMLKDVNKFTVIAQQAHLLSCLADVILYCLQTSILAKEEAGYGIHNAMLAKATKEIGALLPKLRVMFQLFEQVLEGKELGDMAQAKATLDFFSNMSKAKA